MKSYYLDSLDPYYSISHYEVNPKQEKDYVGIGAIIFTFTVMSIVIALSIYTAWQLAYGQYLIDKIPDTPENSEAITDYLLCMHENPNHFKMCESFYLEELVNKTQVPCTYKNIHGECIEELEK
jgi:hypothetical protein